MTPEEMEARLSVGLIVWLLALATAALFILAFVNIPKENQTLFTTIVSGLVVGSIATFVAYRWGSARGSQSKDAVIATLAQKSDPP